jgi:glycosyltransferase involved in cell wall biosynthesis
VTEYIEAARIVHRAHPEVHIQLLGALDPNPSAISARELARWRTEGIVDYLGTTSDVRPFLARAHVCVLPSYGEGMPRAILEAMATGRAILTTDVPGCRETVVAKRNGLLVPARDSQAIAEAMLQLIADPSGLERMGRESRAIAEERFDVHEVNRAILEALGVD